MSHVIPLLKSGSKSIVSNYRPITIQPVIGKIFEKCVLSIISPLFKNMIIPEQHGFVQGRSTVTNLLTFQSTILRSFDAGQQVDVIYTDFSKAFDKVNHCILLSKLSALGINGPLLLWFTSYLTNRFHYVKILSSQSFIFRTTSGVPQGSHLGPFLFLIFINDISFQNCFFLLFADDLKIFRPIASEGDCCALQGAIHDLDEWCRANDMFLNVDKCHIMTFHRISNPITYDYQINSSSLSRVHSVKDLGVHFLPNLSFNLHIDKICNKSYQLLGFIYRITKEFTDPVILRSLFCSLVRPGLEYASIVWSPYTTLHIDLVENIQRKLLRTIGTRTGFQPLDVPIRDIQNMLRLPSLNSRRNILDLLFLHKLLHNLIDSPYLLSEISLHIPVRVLRHQPTFHIPYSKTLYSFHSPLRRILRLGNDLDPDIDILFLNPTQFKRAITNNVNRINNI